MTATNPYCQRLGIQVPRLEAAKHSPDASSHSLLIVALLERGAPITLAEAADRFQEAGIAPADEALASLKRCRPGRPPIYRDGDHYALDAHDQETDLWAFRLGLRPSKAAQLPPIAHVAPAARPLPTLDQPLTVADLDEAWREGVSSGWSAQRVAICVLDAHGGVLAGSDALAFVGARCRWSLLSAESSRYWRSGAAVCPREDGQWLLDAAHPGVRSARQAVRARLEVVRRWAHDRPDPVLIEARNRHFVLERAEHGERLARMSRVIVHTFPVTDPKAVVLLDVGRHELVTFVGDELAGARSALAGYDIIAGVSVRELLRNLGVDSGEARLGELGPPQKTMQINQRGRTLKISTKLLVQGSCGIGQPFGDPTIMARYLDGGEWTKFRRRLEADAKSLHALYQYGRLHHRVRVRWGFLDELISAPWVHRDEDGLYALMLRALNLGIPLELVVGSAPGWSEPWARMRRGYVDKDNTNRRPWLVDEEGRQILESDVQLARLSGEVAEQAEGPPP